MKGHNVWERAEPGCAPQYFDEECVPTKFSRKFDYWLTRAVWRKVDPSELRQPLFEPFEALATVDANHKETAYVHEDVACYLKQVKTLYFKKEGGPPEEVKHAGVDALFAIDDDRLVGVQIQALPDFARDDAARIYELEERNARLQKELAEVKTALDAEAARPESDKVCIVVTASILADATDAAYNKWVEPSTVHTADRARLRESLQEALCHIPGTIVVA